MKLERLDNLEMVETNGGGVAGAVIGGVFGTAGGMVVGSLAASVLVVNGQGDEAGHVMLKCTTKGLTGGVVAGAISPL